MQMTFEEFKKEVIKKKGIIDGVPKVWKSVSVVLKGEYTNFKFGENVKVDGLSYIDYGGENTVIIGDGSKINGMIKIGRGCQLSIGENFSSTGGLKLHLSEAKKIDIGNNCMFGIDVAIYNHDYHPIFSKESGQRINYSSDVIISNEVWLANKVTVLKGVTINDGSIIGIGSIVSSDIDEYCLAVGIPAKVVKTGVVWNRASLNTSHLDGINHLSEV